MLARLVVPMQCRRHASHWTELGSVMRKTQALQAAVQVKAHSADEGIMASGLSFRIDTRTFLFYVSHARRMPLSRGLGVILSTSSGVH